ncbi:unnamed protein product [Rotaria sordida]|uniref:Uncharacterized protein n=1 Tax=Rotaria sordida TaxID=392033 RepID=A0A815ETS8_9BILA|nr:unnamed protein product [Rotaria sordida]CAF1310697.1 unnamed protein product [Rotaria sordida]
MPGLVRLKQLSLSPLQLPNDTTQNLVYRNPNARITWDGIETYKRCIFRNWTPGEEYTQILTFRNLSGKNVTFTYEVPKTRYFQTIYPRRLTLSQGVTFNLPIQFSPLEKVPYVDELIVYINQTQYHITLAGLLPQYRLSLEPKELNFGYCAIQDIQIRSFKLRNIGDLETNIEWNSNEPFIIEPRECILPVGGIQTFTCSFQPQWALIYVGTATCIYGNQSVYELHLHGIGKFPHIIVHSDDGSIDENTGNILVPFGDMPMNGILKHELILFNQSTFRVPFRIESLPGVAKFDTAFYFGKTEGILEAGKRQTIAIKFQPKACEQYYRDFFNVNTQQGNLVTAVVECSGKSIGNLIEISHQRITFGQVLANSTTNRTIEIYNSQETSIARFQIYTSPDSPFHFSIENGTLIGDGSKLTIIITFTPTYPMGYYKIVPILIEHQSPILLELIGTCHSDTGKPPVLNDRYIKNFKQQISHHLALYPFEILSDYLKRGRLILDQSGSIMETNDQTLINDIKIIKDEHDYILPPLLNPLKDNYLYWFSNEDNTHFEYVTLSETCFIFDQCSLDQTNEWQQSLTITNLTRGKLIVIWLIKDPSIFSIIPTETELLPLKSTAFRIIFRPTIIDTFYTKHFEGYVYYKNQRDFTLVPDYGVMLPVKIDLTCIGNTLRLNHEILPLCEFDRDIIIFPPIGEQISIYQTLILTNTGTIPLIYRFLTSSNDDTLSHFTFKPSNGYIKPGDYAIIIVRYKPIRSSNIINNNIYQERIIVRLNEREKFDKILNIFATQDKARLLIPNDGHIYALTTCIGLSSETHLQLKSITRSKLEFNWSLDNNITSLYIEPKNGYFNSYEEKDFLIIYKPKDEGKISMPAKLTCWIGDRTKYGAETYHITIHASTRDGYLRANELHHDLGPIALGTSITYDLYITNIGDCLLRYRLYTKQTILDKKKNSNNLIDNEEMSIIEFISIENNQSEIDGKAKICIPCRIHPFSRSYYQIEIFYELLDDNNQCLSEHKHHLCTLNTHGVYPHLTFIDILGSQQSASLSKGLLSKAFNLTKINALLAKEPTPDELTYAINSPREEIFSKKLNTYRKNKIDNGIASPLPPLEQPEAISFNFNAAPMNSAPSEVHLLLENSSDLDTTWAFLFPKDLQCELEYWARTGDFTEEELNEMKLQDNKIFSINPKKGILKKGSNVTITITYKHIFAGQHTLPAIFKVGRGRQIMLNLVGISVEPGERYVQFYSTTHHLLPVELGAQGAPVQQYELWNGGTVPIHFQVDMSQLEQISLSNYGFWVLDCLTPEGIIVPNKSFVTQWVFNPLEAREYVFNIKIDLENCEPAFITFIGSGFDKRDISSDISKSLTENLEITKQLNLSDRLASLTIDRINFGNLPLFTKQRHITFLKNQSNKDSISFIWHVTNPEQVRHIRIQPVRGKIQPRQSLPIKVTFMAIEAPAFHDIDLVCEIYNETTLNQYNLDLKKWEINIQKKWESFEIDDEEYKACLRSGILDDNDKQQQLIENQFHQGSTLQMCKTLPPVLVNYELDESNIDRARRLRANIRKQQNTRPQMPIPELLHLAFTARTLVYNEYLDLCTNTNELGKFFIDTCLGGDYRSKSSKKRSKKTEEDELIDDADDDDDEFNTNNNDQITVTVEETDLLCSTLSDLLRNLLSDRVFADTLPEMIAEKIPYFSQLQYTRSSKTNNQQQQQQRQESRLLKDYQTRTNLDEINTTEPDQSFLWSSIEPENTLNNRSELISKAKIVKQTLSTPSSLSDFEQQKNLDDNERLKNNPNITSLIEDILENTMWNILQEAYHNEFSLTARPRLIALPPKRQSSLLTRSILQTDSNQSVFPSPPLILTESFD